MKVDRQKLIDILKAVKPGLASKEIVEQSTSFVFHQAGVSTYNDEIMISHPINLDIKGAVQAQQFYNLLSKCKDKEIEISMTEKELRVKGARFKSGIRLDAEINLPIGEIPLPGKSEWKPLPEDFTRAIQYCLFSASTDMSKPLLTCIHLITPIIESCDNQRLTRYILDGDIRPETRDSILLPASSATQLINYPVNKYGITEGWIHFKTKEGVIFSSRTMEGEYPNLKRILEVEGTSITFPPDMVEALNRAEIMSDADITRERIVNFEIKKNSLIVKSESKIGWYEEEFRVRYSGPSIQFGINAQFLREILTHLRKAEIAEDGSRLKFIGDNFSHLISLVKGGE